jgi:hypothetical protein
MAGEWGGRCGFENTAGELTVHSDQTTAILNERCVRLSCEKRRDTAKAAFRHERGKKARRS